MSVERRAREKSWQRTRRRKSQRDVKKFGTGEHNGSYSSQKNRFKEWMWSALTSVKTMSNDEVTVGLGQEQVLRNFGNGNCDWEKMEPIGCGLRHNLGMKKERLGAYFFKKLALREEK